MVSGLVLPQVKSLFTILEWFLVIFGQFRIYSLLVIRLQYTVEFDQGTYRPENEVKLTLRIETRFSLAFCP